ncbi:hypothetical protein Bbelb_434690 [Branchiostoma belcheri]|nr:hypothetical protein Bbelb_434690 [Branchiostoma belcheri]
MSRVPYWVSPVITQKSHIGNNAAYISSWRDWPCSTETGAPEGEGSVLTDNGDKQTWKSRPCHHAGEFWPGSQSLNSQPVVAPDPALINYGVADCQSGLCYRGLDVTICNMSVQDRQSPDSHPQGYWHNDHAVSTPSIATFPHS